MEVVILMSSAIVGGAASHRSRSQTRHSWPSQWTRWLQWAARLPPRSPVAHLWRRRKSKWERSVSHDMSCDMSHDVFRLTVITDSTLKYQL